MAINPTQEQMEAAARILTLVGSVRFPDGEVTDRARGVADFLVERQGRTDHAAAADLDACFAAMRRDGEGLTHSQEHALRQGLGL